MHYEKKFSPSYSCFKFMFSKNKKVYSKDLGFMQKELHDIGKMENWLGTFYLGGLRLGNLGEALDRKGRLDQIRDKGGKIKTFRKRSSCVLDRCL